MKRTSQTSRSLPAGLLLPAAFACLALAAPASAQQAASPVQTASPPPQSVIAPIQPAPGEATAGGQSGASPVTDLLQEAQRQAQYPPSPFEVGPLKLLPHLLYRYLYGDGIQPEPGFQATTAVNTLSPGISGLVGDHWTFDYTPTWNWYSNHVFHDSVDQSAAVTGSLKVGDDPLQVAQTYVQSHNPLVETGMQTEERDYVTSLEMQHDFNSVLLLDANADQALRFANGFPSSREWDTTDWLRYKLSPRLVASGGASAGYVTVSEGADQFYYGPEAQLGINASDELRADLTAGYQMRTFIEHPRQHLDSPIYSADVVYSPTQTTRVTLTGSREIGVSYFVDQTTQTTDWDLKLEQRFLKHLFLTADLDEEYVHYLSTVSADQTVRADHDQIINLRLGTTFLRRGTIAALYQRSRNVSSLAGYGFVSNQVGFEIAYRY
jgi:hypothetical protein